ncbi:hypothetical protein [Staphylococcus pasteuri]|uniref:hypothetical protein n=1 Tax=Staphylococcus pasteuri TaxID=45972 RepID=UPI001649B118|nr:hypothetical protein [Staphylococcus pasteuri]
MSRVGNKNLMNKVKGVGLNGRRERQGKVKKDEEKKVRYVGKVKKVNANGGGERGNFCSKGG